MLQASPTAPLLKVENLVVEYSVGGKTVPNARTAIARSGCRPGRITYVGRANRRADRVVKSNRKAGVSLPARSKVNLVVRR